MFGAQTLSKSPNVADCRWLTMNCNPSTCSKVQSHVSHKFWSWLNAILFPNLLKSQLPFIFDGFHKFHQTFPYVAPHVSRFSMFFLRNPRFSHGFPTFFTAPRPPRCFPRECYQPAAADPRERPGRCRRAARGARPSAAPQRRSRRPGRSRDWDSSPEDGIHQWIVHSQLN